MYSVTDRVRRTVSERGAGASARSTLTTGRARALLATALLASVVACDIIPAPYRVDLYQTRWAVDAVGGNTLAAPVTMSFNEGGVDAVVAVRTPCGATQLSLDMDSDGVSIFFGGPVDVIETLNCSTGQQTADKELLEAVFSVNEWKVLDDNHITLIGSEELSLSTVIVLGRAEVRRAPARR